MGSLGLLLLRPRTTPKDRVTGSAPLSLPPGPPQVQSSDLRDFRDQIPSGQSQLPVSAWAEPLGLGGGSSWAGRHCHSPCTPGVQVVSVGRKVPELHMLRGEPAWAGAEEQDTDGATPGGQELRATDRPQGKGREERNTGCGHPLGPDQGGPVGPVHNVTRRGEPWTRWGSSKGGASTTPG